MTRTKVATRSKHPRPDGLETKHGVHVFLDELREVLVAEAKRDPAQQAEPVPPTNPNIVRTAALHGVDLLALGFSAGEVVHDYGDVCLAVTELAVELDAPISAADFHTLNQCLDDAIAAAVTAWAGGRAMGTVQRVSRDETLRQLVHGAIVMVDLLRTGQLAPAGSTARVLRDHLEHMDALLGAQGS
jgi:hypothetical protein